MSGILALDTSVVVPLLVKTHSAHEPVKRWLSGRTALVAGHALAESFAVLTRLPGDLRLTPADAARLLNVRLPGRLTLRPETAADLPTLLARLDIAGGAAYDALVALAALEHDAVLATRDARAKDTYERVGVAVVVAA